MNKLKIIMLSSLLLVSNFANAEKWVEMEDQPFEGLKIETLKTNHYPIGGVDSLWVRFILPPDKWVVVNTQFDCETMVHTKMYRQTNENKMPNLQNTPLKMLTSSDMLWYPVDSFCRNKAEECKVKDQQSIVEDLTRTQGEELSDILKQEFSDPEQELEEEQNLKVVNNAIE